MGEVNDHAPPCSPEHVGLSGFPGYRARGTQTNRSCSLKRVGSVRLNAANVVSAAATVANAAHDEHADPWSRTGVNKLIELAVAFSTERLSYASGDKASNSSAKLMSSA